MPVRGDEYSSTILLPLSKMVIMMMTAGLLVGLVAVYVLAPLWRPPLALDGQAYSPQMLAQLDAEIEREIAQERAQRGEHV